ncbi:MAG: zinc ribbon domain-containing protein [Ktedonobacteraceae bacterium]
MATLCTHCGTTLKDAARYCNNCGTLAPSHPFSSKFVPPAPPALPADGQNGSTRVVKPEQIAQHSPSRPARYSAPSEPPSWMSQLDNQFHNQSEAPSNGMERDRPENPFAVDVVKADGLEKHSEKGSDPSSTLQLDFPVPEPVHQAGSAVRELHVKVWEQEEPVSAATSPEKLIPAQNEEQDTIGDVPTRPLISSSGSKLADKLTQRDEVSSPASKMPTARFDAVERLNTVPLSTAPKVNPVSQSVKEPGQHQRWEQSRQQSRSIEHPTRDRPVHQSVPGVPDAPAYTPSNSRSILQERSGISPAFTYSPSIVPAQDMRQTPPPQVSVPPKPHRKSRKPLVLVSLLLLVLVGGVGAWVVVWQPFSVPGITQPQQNFKDTRLGFSLLYPGGWRFQVDQGKTTTHFYDSSHTAQVNIVVGFANGGDLGRYLQQEASQLGMTGQKKGSPLSFAGASWQQIQGSVLESGASYTETVIVTVHNQHLFTILLLAPQITYAQEDQLVFSSMRSSFQFVA